MAAFQVHDGALQVFDVEHGACALLTVPAGDGGWKRMLIDCGHNATTKWYPGKHLRSLGVTHLDVLVITNYDEDHLSGYPNLLQQSIDVRWILRNPTVSPQTICKLKSDTGTGPGIDALVTSLANFATPASTSGELPIFQGVKIEWFYNPYPYFQDENNLSLVLHLTIHGFSFLFPGDMERAGLDNMLSTNLRFRAVVGGINVLVASHHGRESGICPTMFDVWGCRPTLVIISDDYKQYDTQETANYYASKCSGIANFRYTGNTRKVLTTRKDGEIIFSFANGGCRVT